MIRTDIKKITKNIKSSSKFIIYIFLENEIYVYVCVEFVWGEAKGTPTNTCNPVCM